MRLVFLLEEPSMKYFLDGLLPRVLPPEMSYERPVTGSRKILIFQTPPAWRYAPARGVCDVLYVILKEMTLQCQQSSLSRHLHLLQHLRL